MQILNIVLGQTNIIPLYGVNFFSFFCRGECHVYGMCGRVSRIIKSLDRVHKLRELKRHRNMH